MYQHNLETNQTLDETSLVNWSDEVYTQVKEQKTQLIQSPTVSEELRDMEHLDKILSNGITSSLIITIDENLNVINNKNKKICNIVEILEKIKGNVLPIFNIKKDVAVDELVEFLQENIQSNDFMIMSSSPDIVKIIRENCNRGFGCVEYQNIKSLKTLDEKMKILNTTNKGNARIAVLPIDILTKENVEFLQKRLITVWADMRRLKKDLLNKKYWIHKAITLGVNGIISKHPKEIKDEFRIYEEYPAMIRYPFLIGHRGIPSLAPENTLEGNRIAFEKGTDIIETDIHVTKDNKLVCIHDDTLLRTTNYHPKNILDQGKVREHTLEEIKQLLANKQFTDKFPNAKVPTLEEMLDEIKGKNVILFIEIKSWVDDNIEQLLKDIIIKKDMKDQVVVISFIEHKLKKMREIMPEVSIGYLDYKLLDPLDVNTSLNRVMQAIQPLNATYNPAYGKLTLTMIQASRHRGITLWPWTFRDTKDMIKYFMYGVNGITTDYSQNMSKVFRTLKSEVSNVDLKIGESQELLGKVTSYDKKIYEIEPEILVIDNKEVLSIDNNKIKGKKKGETLILLKYKTKIEEQVYNIYSEPIHVNIF